MSAKDLLKDEILKKAIVHGKVILSSGKEADYYVDLRRVTLDATASPLVGEVMLELTKDLDFEAVGGLTLGADPVATAMMHVAAKNGRKLDSFVVRKAEKAHGLQRRIEGPASFTFGAAPRSTMTATATTMAPAALNASTAVKTDPPVVEVSSTAKTLRPLTSGPSIRFCNLS